MKFKLIAIAALAVVAAATGAASAGSMRKPAHYTLDRSQWLKLAGTSIECGAYLPDDGAGKARISFECAGFRSGWPRPRSYGARIGEWGADLLRYDSTGKTHTIGWTYRNPVSTDLEGGSGVRQHEGKSGKVVTLHTGDYAFLGDTDVICKALIGPAPPYLNGKDVLGWGAVPFMACDRYQPIQGGWSCCLLKTNGLWVSEKGVLAFEWRQSGKTASQAWIRQLWNPGAKYGG